MKSKTGGVLVLTFLCFLSLGGIPLAALTAKTGEIVEPAQAVSSAPPPYILQASDALEIFVYNHPELTRKVVIQPDGRISIPLVQGVVAAGSTQDKLKAELEKRLEKFIDLPNVTVIIDAIQSYRVYVTGKVQRPGAIQSVKPITVLQAIALAGGFVEYAKQQEIRIVRSGPKPLNIPFNYVDATNGKDPLQNRLLESDDVVMVP